MWKLNFYCVLKVIVSLYTLYYLFRMLKFINKMWVAPMWKKPIDLKSTGDWAVITGCTDGIGREYAVQLATRGMNLVLMSRSESKLRKLQDYLRDEYCVAVKIIEIDFTRITNSYSVLAENLEGLDIGVLINNVGMLNGYKRFLQDDYSVMRDMVEINVNGMVLMTSIILPQMVEKKRGVIINIGSYSSLVETPLMACYAATKKFILKFSEDLRIEYENCGITIQCQTPFFIATKLARIESPNIFVPTSEKYVESAISTVGIHNVTCGYFIHDIMIALHRVGLETLPFIANFITNTSINTVRNKCDN